MKKSKKTQLDETIEKILDKLSDDEAKEFVIEEKRLIEEEITAIEEHEKFLENFLKKHIKLIK